MQSLVFLLGSVAHVHALRDAVLGPFLHVGADLGREAVQGETGGDDGVGHSDFRKNVFW